MTIVRHQDTRLDGSAPCLIYGYGAWETVIEPSFDSALLVLLEHGVVFAHAHVRGGGELGRTWWEQGRRELKQTTFTDLIDVAVDLGQATVDRDRLVARGRSAGGLAMGAVYSQRPDIWRGIVAEVPFVDPVTTMLDPTAPLVAVEWDEWGDPRCPADLAWMLDWSPYEALPPLAERPRLRVTSALYDSRVSVWEPARWVERLRSTGSSDSEVVFRVELGPGAHAIPEGRYARMSYLSEIYVWVADCLGIDLGNAADSDS